MGNQILKAAKELKTSIKFKNFSISADLSVCQRSKLNFTKKEFKVLQLFHKVNRVIYIN
jgi:hypothetical protein